VKSRFGTAAGAALALAAAPVLAQTPRPAPGEGPARHAPRSTTAAITRDDAMTRVYVLADDSMMGRDAGTRGNVMGTDYIAAEARRIGLRPAGENGTFFQTVPMVRRTLDPQSSFTPRGGNPLKLWEDFAPLPQVEGFFDVATTLAAQDAPVVYGGRWGDPAAIAPEQARGRFVVFAAPAAPNGRPDFRIWTKGPMTRYAGALGIAIATMDASPPDFITFLRDEQLVLSGEPGRQSGPPVMVVTSIAAERLLGAPLTSLQPGAAAAGGRTVTGGFRASEERTEFPARNVVAILPGSDARLRGQYVAIGAHNDHVGIAGHAEDHDSVRVHDRLFRRGGAEDPERPLSAVEAARLRAGIDSLRRVRPARLDSIFNGADDDASGSAAVLEIAQQMAARPPRRSVLFVWHTAEEKGLFGSQYFTEHPTVPRDSIVAQLNIDMIGRGRADDVERGGGPGYLQLVGSRRLSTQLGDLVEEVNRTGSHGFTFDYSMDADRHEANIYCRSDHYNYARWGIPVTFFTTGGHADYHMITDEPQYVDFDKLVRVSRFIGSVAEAVANRDARPVVDKPKPDPYGRCQQ
jgi:hypothetical protein